MQRTNTVTRIIKRAFLEEKTLYSFLHPFIYQFLQAVNSTPHVPYLVLDLYRYTLVFFRTSKVNIFSVK